MTNPERKRILTIDRVSQMQWDNDPVDHLGARLKVESQRWDDKARCWRINEARIELNFYDLCELAALIQTRLKHMEDRVEKVRQAFETGRKFP